MKDDTKTKTIRFYNKSRNKIESDLENRGKSDKKLNLDKALSKTKKIIFMQSILKK